MSRNTLYIGESFSDERADKYRAPVIDEIVRPKCSQCGNTNIAWVKTETGHELQCPSCKAVLDSV